MKSTQDKRTMRHNRIRAKISGTSTKPRISVFKSNSDTVVQLIDDTKGVTLVHVLASKMKGKTKAEKAKEAGVELAKKAIAHKIKTVVFDRGGYIYTGRVKSVADGAREGGLIF